MDTPEGRQHRLKLTKDALEHAKAELGEHLSQLGVTLHAHMDDCDMDYRRFWCHIRVPGYERWARGDVYKPHLRKVRGAKMAGLLNRIRHLVCSYITERTDYQLEWVPTGDKPKARRTSWQGVSEFSEKFTAQLNEFSHYVGDTWIYVLSFYGVEPTNNGR